jgi:hypothetical protein
MDNQIPSGERWEQVLRDKIATCSAVIVVVSPDAALSTWVDREVRYARRLGKRIIPIRYRGGRMDVVNHLQFGSASEAGVPSDDFIDRLRRLPPYVPAMTRIIGPVPGEADCFQDRRLASNLDGSLVSGDVAELSGLPKRSTQILSGLGGVGKTQIAASIAQSLHAAGDLDLLIWVTAHSRDTIWQGYAQGAIELGRASESDVIERSAQKFRDYLASIQSNWLVVLDDLSDPNDLIGWWPPRTATGRVIVTTRRRDAALSTHGTIVTVGPFSEYEASAYFSEKLADEPSKLDQVAELADDLGYLPLALAQAAAYIRDRDISCADYRALFAQRRNAVELAPDGLPDDYLLPVTITLGLSIDLANELRPVGLARPLLTLLSFLDPSGIPASLVKDEYGPVARYLGRSVPSFSQLAPIEKNDAGLSCLVRLNLATVISESITTRRHSALIIVHAIVQRAMRDQISDAERKNAAIADAEALLYVWPPLNNEEPLCSRLRANAMYLERQAEDEIWRADHPILGTIGHSLIVAGLYMSGVTYYQHLVETALRRRGADHEETIAFRHNLAIMRAKLGDAATAAAELSALLRDQERVIGTDHQGTISTRHNLAALRSELGDPEDATIELESVLADYLRIYGPGSGSLAIRSSLALARAEAGFLFVAHMELQRLLGDYEGRFGPKWHAALVTRRELARLAGESGFVNEAVASLEYLLEISHEMGPMNPDYLAIRRQLSRWRGQGGDSAYEASALTDLVSDCQDALGPNHPETLWARYELGRLRGITGSPKAAVTDLEVLAIDRARVLGPDHPQTLVTRIELAKWHGKAGDVVGATAELELVIADQARILSRNHPQRIAARYELANVHGMSGHPDIAVAELETLLDDRLQVFAPYDPMPFIPAVSDPWTRIILESRQYWQEKLDM